MLKSLGIENYPTLPLGHQFDFNKTQIIAEICISQIDIKSCDYKLEPAFTLYITFCSLYEHFEPFLFVDGQFIQNLNYQTFNYHVSIFIQHIFLTLKVFFIYFFYILCRKIQMKLLKWFFGLQIYQNFYILFKMIFFFFIRVKKT